MGPGTGGRSGTSASGGAYGGMLLHLLILLVLLMVLIVILLNWVVLVLLLVTVHHVRLSLIPPAFLYSHILIDPGGLGGGAISIITTDLIVSGTIAANGAAATMEGGGGSGGAILIRTGSFTGANTGLISSNGGSAVTYSSTNGGGGSGGRIAVYFDSNTFGGTITASGAMVPRFDGGSGTIYLHDQSTNHRLLMVNNVDNDIYTPTVPTIGATVGSMAWITEPGVSTFEFDEIQLTRKGSLGINPTSTTDTVSLPFVKFYYIVGYL